MRNYDWLVEELNCIWEKITYYSSKLKIYTERSSFDTPHQQFIDSYVYCAFLTNGKYIKIIPLWESSIWITTPWRPNHGLTEELLENWYKEALNQLMHEPVEL